MVGKRAKILSPDHVETLLVFAAQTRHPIRKQVLVLRYQCCDKEIKSMVKYCPRWQ